MDGVVLNGPRARRLPGNLNVSFLGVTAEAFQELCRRCRKLLRGLLRNDDAIFRTLMDAVTPYAEAFREHYLAQGFVGFDGLLSLARRGAAPVLLAAIVAFSAGHSVSAQQGVSDADQSALEAALQTRLAYVLTGDTEIDNTSRLGLSGLGKVLTARTAIEPGPPIGVNVDSDELAFFPLLYWPVRQDAEALPEATLARIDAYMKQGGMIVFDTRDYQQSLPSGGGGTQGPGAAALSRLLGKLDIPPLD